MEKTAELTLKDGEDYGGVNPLEALENIKKRFQEKKEGKKSLRKTALVLQGGGMRGVFGAGVCCALEELGYTKAFDEVYGVSAGALNAAYFLSGQAAYGTTIYYQDINNSDFINLFRGRKIVNIDFLMDIICSKKPLNVKRLFGNPTLFNIVLTKVSTGEAVIFKSNAEGINIFDLLKATAAIPFVYDIPVNIQGVDYLDGGVSCPIPVVEAIDRGCTDILVVLTRPRDYNPSLSEGIFIHLITGTRIKRHGEKFYRAYRNKNRVYRERLSIVKGEKNYRDKKVNILGIFPGHSLKIRRMTKRKNILKGAAIEGAVKTLKLFGEVSPHPVELLRFINF